MRTLGIALATESNVSLCIQEKSATIKIPLDFWARAKLREANIPYVTPSEFFDFNESSSIDDQAVDLARNWYKSTNIFYKGISIPQMAECDFAYLFIDTLRCIKIARNILDQVHPDSILLPPKAATLRPGLICYETLPNAIAYLARQQKIPCKTLGRTTPNYQRITKFIKGIRKTVLPHSPRTQCPEGTILCLDTPETANRIDDELENYRCIHSNPQQLATKDTECFAKSLRHSKPPNLTYASLMVDQFQEFYRTHAIKIAETIEWANQFIKETRPRMIIAIEDITPLYRAAIKTFVQRNIPVLVIQHAACIGHYVADLALMPVEAPKQAVWGEFCYDYHIKGGIRPEVLVITGNPRFDSIHKVRPLPETYNKFLLNPNRRIITIATEWYLNASAGHASETDENAIRITLKAMRPFTNYQVVVKLHPGYQGIYEGIVKQIAKEEGISITIARDDLWNLIAISDIVIISESTVGLEAMILQKPVIVTKLSAHGEIPSYVSSGAAIGAYTPEEIVAAIKTIIGNDDARNRLTENAKAYVLDHCYLQDGKASQRIAKIIEETCLR